MYGINSKKEADGHIDGFGCHKTAEISEPEEIFFESDDELENNFFAAESDSVTEESMLYVPDETTGPSHEKKRNRGLKTIKISFKESFTKKSTGGSEKSRSIDDEEFTQTPRFFKSKKIKDTNGEKKQNFSFNKFFPSPSFAVSRKNEMIEEIVSYQEEMPAIPPEPEFIKEQEFSEVERHWLKAPHSYVCIYEDTNKNSFYKVFEPEITIKERIILEETDSHLKSVIIYDNPAEKRPKAIESSMISEIVRNFDNSITKERISVIEYYLRRNFEGYGKLDPLMRDENIEDITCNGSGLPVYIYHRKYANLPTNIVFEPTEINRFVLKLAQKADKQLSLTSPLVDAALPEGARAQITYTDVVSSKGSSFTIRKFRSEPMTPIDLIYYGTYDPEVMAFIWLAVESRKSMIVVGGTACGKTSTLNAVSLFIPRHSKVVSLEDTRELYMPHENWLPMKTRESAAESNKGNVDMFSLLRSALRQRPEYIIVGEVRGSEAQTLFQAMNTGHTTYSTLHAGGVEQAVNRLTTSPINVPVAMFGALDLIVIQQLQYVNGRMVRRCTSLNEVVVEKNEIICNKLYEWDPVTDSFMRTENKSMVLRRIAYMHGWTSNEILEELRLRKEVLEKMSGDEVSHFREISEGIENFRREYVY